MFQSNKKPSKCEAFLIATLGNNVFIYFTKQQPKNETKHHPPIGLLAKLASAYIVDGTQAELIGARRDETTNDHAGGLRLNVGQQHRPRGV